MSHARQLVVDIIRGTRKMEPGDLRCTFNETTKRWVPATMSGLQQARLRRAATIFDIDVPGITDRPGPAPIRLARVPKGTKKERSLPGKQESVRRALEQMPRLLETWRQERKREREKSRPKYPF